MVKKRAAYFSELNQIHDECFARGIGFTSGIQTFPNNAQGIGIL